MNQRQLDPRIKLRHIACFLEIARLKSVVAAASALGISQPAASKTLQELEGILGVRLFDRSRRNLFPTAQGEVFQRYAGTSMMALLQGVQSVSQAQQETLIKVGALPTVSARILPRAVARFSALDVAARTRIVTGPNDYLLSLLRVGEVDLVIGRMAEPDAITGMTFEHLYTERVVFVVRPGHPLLEISPFALTMIEPYQVLVPPPGSVIQPLVERLLTAHEVAGLRDEIETVSNAFGRSYVRNSDAVWIISEGVVVEDLADGTLVRLPVETIETSGPVGLTTRTELPLSAATQLLIQTVREVATEPA